MTLVKLRFWMASGRTLQLLVGTTALLASVTAAAGQASLSHEPTAAAGYVITQKLCSTCHLTEGSAARPVTVGIPSLSGIANKPEQTPSSVTLKLISPPHPMPDMQLTRDEIDDIIAYLATLRTAPGVPSWNLPSKGDAPKYPSPT
jgi:cytochrome c